VDPANFDERVRQRSKTGRTYPGRAGWCLFFRKETLSHFLPIPEELRLWYGDDFIHWKLKSLGYQCLTVDDCCCYHFGSKTVQTVGKIQHIIDADKVIYNRITGDNL
jgi:GT2 family glycosyltransferase